MGGYLADWRSACTLPFVVEVLYMLGRGRHVRIHLALRFCSLRMTARESTTLFKKYSSMFSIYKGHSTSPSLHCTELFQQHFKKTIKMQNLCAIMIIPSIAHVYLLLGIATNYQYTVIKLLHSCSYSQPTSGPTRGHNLIPVQFGFSSQWWLTNLGEARNIKYWKLQWRCGLYQWWWYYLSKSTVAGEWNYCGQWWHSELCPGEFWKRRILCVHYEKSRISSVLFWSSPCDR